MTSCRSYRFRSLIWKLTYNLATAACTNFASNLKKEIWMQFWSRSYKDGNFCVIKLFRCLILQNSQPSFNLLTSLAHLTSSAPQVLLVLNVFPPLMISELHLTRRGKDLKTKGLIRSKNSICELQITRAL